MTKTCNTCGEIKPEEAFSPNYHGGYRPICKTCRNRIARETRQPIRSEASCSWCGTTFQRSSGQPFNGNAYCSDSCRSVRNRIFKYSLSFSDYRRLLERADGRCEICNAKRTLTIDHCHETGTVRGLICHRCNIGLGHMGDSVERAYAFADYLAKHRQLRLALPNAS